MAEAGGQGTLGIHVHQENTLAVPYQPDTQIDRCNGLSNTTFWLEIAVILAIFLISCLPYVHRIKTGLNQCAPCCGGVSDLVLFYQAHPHRLS